MSDKTSDKTSDKRLLPCPFCGGEAKFITGSPFIWEHAVACGECGTATRMIGGVTPSMARNRVAQVWNTRKPMQEIVERLEDLKQHNLNEAKKCSEFENFQVYMNDNRGFYRDNAKCYEVAIEVVKEEGGIE